ncbi:MAG TPA: tRNA uridine(34) 5-carboxymethylaminomethyl modification radical SAM/GNAT enzyme Elp3 [bacterium]|nr:tRNA uridine(34) 5-carboxymethylaminomethyl modification radical SAM/GNAT enzyme Elp3 [bacterium]
MYKTEKYAFNPEEYKEELLQIFKEIQNSKNWNEDIFRIIQAKHPKDKSKMFSKNDLIKGLRYFTKLNLINNPNQILQRIRMKPVRTLSGVTPVTVLTKPWACPGKCIYCPNEPNMPKSYIESEPGAQRALFLDFDPYMQTAKRIQSLQHIGHNTEKIELIVLGGSWSVYPENYKRWFIKRCFEAMNNPNEEEPNLSETKTSWEELEQEHKKNETAKHKCVGLSLETRPDLITKEEVVKLRRYGATKIQLGVQSLDDEILTKNLRGHTADTTKKAFELLRLAGFKIHAHWMVNLYGATPETEIEDFQKLWTPNYCPDELKIYPTSVIANTRLAELYNTGEYIPYSTQKLIEIVGQLKTLVPPFCRITRVIRDIPSQEIIAGSRVSNLRQDVKKYLDEKGLKCNCIRCREIKQQEVFENDLKLETIQYETTVSKEYFFSFVTPENRIAGFLRLSVPFENLQENHFIEELRRSAIIREIHVYGSVVGIGKEEVGKAQHFGLGKKLIEKAEEICRENVVKNLAVISAIGTRDYYRKWNFIQKRNSLYMHKTL